MGSGNKGKGRNERKETGMRMRAVDNSDQKSEHDQDSNKKEINKLLKDPPKSWRKMFIEEGISETPSISEVLSLLEETAGSNPSLERDTGTNNPKDLTPPDKVRSEAMKGIRLSYEFNYPSYKGIGLARAVQLATQPTIWRNYINLLI